MLIGCFSIRPAHPGRSGSRYCIIVVLLAAVRVWAIASTPLALIKSAVPFVSARKADQVDWEIDHCVP